jgi:MFS family permease
MSGLTESEDIQTAAARRNGRLYLIGLGASLIGSNAMALVAGIWVKTLTGSSAEAGLVSACVYAPAILGPLAGLIADRVRRRRWLLALNLMSAAIMLPLLAVETRGEVWIIFAVMTWYGIDQVLVGAAESALFAEMLPSDLRRSLNGWNLGLQETGRLFAPLFGAGFFTLVGGGGVALFDAATFLIAAAMISRIRFHETRPSVSQRHLGTELLAGLNHIRRCAELRRLVIAATVVIGLSGVVLPAQYSLVQAVGEPPSFLGVLAAGLGLGSIVASLSNARLLRRIGETWLAVIGMLDYALGSAMRASGVLPMVILGSVVLGFALPWVYLAVLSFAQRVTPVELQGRTAAAVTLVLFGPQAPLQAVGSLAVDSLSFRLMYVAAVVVAVATAGGLAWAHRRTRSCVGAQTKH